MGGGGSKPTPEQIRQISANLDLQFSGNCSPSASVQQMIKLNNVKIRARDDCSINFINYEKDVYVGRRNEGKPRRGARFGSAV